MMGPMRRLWLPFGAVALAVLGLLLARPGRRDDDQPRYLTAPVDRGPIHASVSATGAVNPVATVQVGTYVSGPITEIAADFNTPVAKGQLLATIDPRSFRVRVDAATADVANARARLTKDEADVALQDATLRRTRDLHGQGIVSESDLDLAVSRARQARAQVELDRAEIRSSEARLHEAEVNLAYTSIVSPVDGIVVARNVSVGQTVAATFQTPTLFLVAEDLTKMQVSASVSESDIGSVAADQPVTFTVDAYPGTTFPGRVAQVRSAPVTVQNVVTYEVLVHVDNPGLRLKPGMTANVTITTAQRDDALRIRTSALRFRPPDDGAEPGAAAAAAPAAAVGAAVGAAAEGRVWRLDTAGRPQPVSVTTGIADDRFAEILTGLDEGQPVIIGLQRPAAPAAPPGRPPSFTPGRRTGH